MTNGLTERLWATTGFDDVIYCEGRHTVEQTPAEYLGAWRSVNDLQVQLGPDLFQRYLAFIEEKIATLASIPTTYLTRAWAARRI